LHRVHPELAPLQLAVT